LSHCFQVIQKNMRHTGKGFKRAIAALLSIALVLPGSWALPSDKASAQIVDGKFAGASIVAFPGAEGGGAYTSGGRGGDVYIVTNLEDYNDGEAPIEGSLRAGILSTPKEGRTIVFHVSGTIELKRSLRFDNIKNLTIAGQTAPGNGITIAGWDTNISNSENIIIRYMTFRPGATNVFNGSDSMDALWGRDNNYFIIDHSSFSWNTDETLSTYRGENGTIQWSIISESLTLSGHSKGRHGYGGIAGGDKTTFHHNLYVSHTSRNPRIGGGYAGAADSNHVAVLQMSNNVIYNWGFNGTYGGGYNYTNFMNNIEIAGPGTRENVKDRVIDAGEVGKLGGFYISGNNINGKMTGLLDESSEHVKFSGDASGDNKTSIVAEPYLSADSTGANHGMTNQAFDDYLQNGIKEANPQLLTAILQQAGATYPRRDAIDARIVTEVEKGLGRFINTEHEVGGYVSPFGAIEEQRTADFDTNLNGIADAWEKEKGIWDNEDAFKTATDSGYTWLELYINGIVENGHIAENPDAEIVSPANNAQLVLGEDIPVEIKASSEFGHEIAKVAVYNSSQYLGDAVRNGDKYIYTIKGLQDASYFISARVTDSKGNATQTTASHIHVNTNSGTLAAGGWTSADIGAPDIQGTASVTNGVFTVKGNGKLGTSEGSMEQSEEHDAAKDDFHFVYKEFTGDMEFTARLDEIGSADNHAFTGLMVRDDLTDHSATAALGLSWVKISNAYPWSVYLAGRDKQGEGFDEMTETLDSASAAQAAGIQLLPDIAFKLNGKEQPYWLKLGRKGDTFYAYGSADGTKWTPIGERTIAMKDSVYVGFAVDSNDVANELEQLNYAKFSNVSLKKDFKPISEEDNIPPVVKVDGLTEIDPDNSLTIADENNKMIFQQTATSGKMTKSATSPADKVSYMVFPKSNTPATMEMDVTITSKTSTSNDMGLFVGAFYKGDDGVELFNSLGFRNGTAGQSLTGIWNKTGAGYPAGNGSSESNNGSTNTKPSYLLGETYHVIFEKKADGYVVHYTGVDEKGAALDLKKVFKASEAILSTADYLDKEVRLGFAIIGVTAEIQNLLLKDEWGRIMYSQNPVVESPKAIRILGSDTLQTGKTDATVTEAVYDDRSEAILSGVVYSSSREEIAEISSTGVVTARSPGSTVIQATYGDLSDSYQLTVINPVVSVRLAVSQTALEVGDRAQSNVQVVYADDSSSAITEGVTFTSSDSNVASVNSQGVIYANRAGEATITATFSSLEASVKVTVTEDDDEGSSSTGGGSGGPAPLPGKSEELKKLEEQLNSGNTVIELGEGDQKLELPGTIVELLKDEPTLTFKTGQMNVEIPSSVLKGLLELIPADQRTGSTISFGAKPVSDSEMESTLHSLEGRLNASIVAAGDVLDFDLSVTTADGKTSKLSSFSEPITLTFQVNSSADKRLVGVYYIDDSGNLDYIGGDWVNGALSVEVSHFSKYAALEYRKEFADVSVNHWAADTIQILAAKHLLEGVSENEYAPARNVTRAEFTALLVRLLGLTQEAEMTFKDVRNEDWFAKDVSKAVKAGIVNGMSDEAFAPQANITRQEMASMIVRAHEFAIGKGSAAGNQSKFVDLERSADWAKDAVGKAYTLGLIQGRTDSTFEPLETMNRAESAQVVYNLLQIIAKQPK
jgi:hypothetical protein